MSHIKGEIDKVREILREGYEEPIVQTVRRYVLNTGAIGAGVNVYNITDIVQGKQGFVKKIAIGCNDATFLHAVFLTRIPAPIMMGPDWMFFISYFYRFYDWDIGDLDIRKGKPNPLDDDTWTLTIINNVAGTTFTADIYWVEN